MRLNQPGQFRRALKKPTEKKVWQLWHQFPFGKYKGVNLGVVADNDPGLMEWWQNKNKVLFSEPLQKRINDAKNLSK